jgi:RNA polymerase sigma-70 factor (ECF subfamily)
VTGNEAALNADGLTLLSPADEGTSLLRRAKAGDTEAFEQIVRQHERQVFRVALRLLGSVEDAQDAAQETLLRLHRHLGRIDELQSCAAWLYRVTVNVANDMLRKRRKVVPLEEISSRAEADGAVGLEERRELVSRALLELPQKKRAAIVLRDIEGLSTREVAEILESSEATVRSQISTGRVKLKRIVDELMRGTR